MIKSPVVVIGDRALKAAPAVVWPVPPLAMAKVPVTPVERGKPVALVKVAEVGVPKTGVTNVGEVDKTTLPEPVEVVTPVPPLATGRVPVTPVVKGRPVALVRVTEVGVPRTGVIKVGEVDSTLLPDPVDVVTPVPPLATGRVPVTPEVRGKPVALVRVTEVGVPRMGVTKVGDVESTLLPDPVDVVTPVPPYATATVVPCQTPVAIVPTLVKDDETTVLLRVVPDSVPAGAITAAVEAAVSWPCALTVNVGMAVEEPYEAAVTAVLVMLN